MKKLLLPALCMLFASATNAQQVPNQNPNYQQSRSHYMVVKDSLLSTQSTTVQATYKAYDWMQLRQDRKDIRFQNRQQRRLNRSMYGGYYDYQYGYPNNGYNNFNYYGNGNGYNYNYNGYYRSNYYPGNYYNSRSHSFLSDVLWWFLF